MGAEPFEEGIYRGVELIRQSVGLVGPIGHGVELLSGS